VGIELVKDMVEILAEARSLEELGRIEPKAGNIYGRYLDGLPSNAGLAG
jgi:hypothetical protein